SRLLGFQDVAPLLIGSERRQVRGSRGAACLQGQPALFGSGGRQSEGLPERDYLVRALRSAHFASRFNDNYGREVIVNAMGDAMRLAVAMSFRGGWFESGQGHQFNLVTYQWLSSIHVNSSPLQSRSIADAPDKMSDASADY